MEMLSFNIFKNINKSYFLVMFFAFTFALFSELAFGSDTKPNIIKDEARIFSVYDKDTKIEVKLWKSDILLPNDRSFKLIVKPLDESDINAEKPQYFKTIKGCKAYKIFAEDTNGSEIDSKKLFSRFSLGLKYPKWINTESAKNLVIFKLYKDKWEPLQSFVDPTGMIISDNQTELGVYQIFLAPFAESHDVIVYPNPVQFGEFGGINKTLKFRNVPLGSVIEIYTLTGEKVQEIARSDKSDIQWNGKKENGDLVTSGLYFYRIRVSGKDIYGKIAVLR